MTTLSLFLGLFRVIFRVQAFHVSCISVHIATLVSKDPKLGVLGQSDGDKLTKCWSNSLENKLYVKI